MAVQTKVDWFDGRTGTGTQAVTGVGFRPKALILWGMIGGAGGGFNNLGILSLGFGDDDGGTVHQAVTSAEWEGTTGTNPGTSVARTDRIFATTRLGFGTDENHISLVSMDSDGFTVNFDVNTWGAARYYYMAIGGDGVRARVGSFTSGTGDQAVTGVGFQPNAVLFMNGRGGSPKDQPTLGWGCATGQALSAVTCETGSTAANRKRYQRTDRCFAMLGAASEPQASFVSLDADGFTLNWAVASAGQTVYYLALHGVDVKAGTITQPTSAGLASVVTGHQSKAILFTGCGRPGGLSAETNIARMAVGAADGTKQVAQWCGSTWTGSQDDAHRYVTETAAIVAATEAGSGTLEAVAAVNSIGSTSFTVNWTTVDSTQREFSYLSVGEAQLIEVEPADTGATSIGLTWVEFTDKAGVVHVSSKIDLPDPSTYYRGYKEPRVITWGQIVRALSDRAGQYEAGEFGWVWSDTDRVIRGLLDADSTKVFLNRPVTVRMIDDVNRRLLATPRTMWKGLVRGYKPLSPLHFEIKVKDTLASKFSSENTKDQIPARLIGRPDFPGCPTDAINQPVPIIYGTVSDAIAGSNPPLLTYTTSLGSYTFGGYWFSGFGNLTSDAAVPTGLTAVAAAGGALSASVPNSEYGVIVTAVDASGRESDPEPFYWNGPGEGRGSFAFAPDGITGVVVDGTQKLQVSWNASAGAVKYRAYLATFYYGARFQQMIEVNAPTTSCEFTKAPDWSVWNPQASDITPGASFITYGQACYYAVTAVLPDGETAVSTSSLGYSYPYRRPLRLEWQAVTGALEYRVYRLPAGAPSTAWDRRWTVPASQLFFNDDMLDTGVTYINGTPAATGIVPVVYVGTRNDSSSTPWHAFLVCGHAVKEISDVFYDGNKVDSGNFGVTWAVPGKSGFSTYFGSTTYVDINGNRYTLIYVRGPQGDALAQGTAKLTCNVSGIETVGNGSGTLITDLLAIYKHAVTNWILQTYTSGAWLTAPVFEDDALLAKVDETSFDTASQVAQRRISGGYMGGGIIGANGERVSIRDLVARFNVSCDVDSGFNRKSQFFVSMADEAISVLESAVAVSDVNDVHEATFDVEPRVDELFNRVPFRYARDYTGKRPSGWNGEDDQEDADSIDSLDETKSSPTIDLHFVRNATVADDVISRRLLRSKEPPTLVKWATSMAGLNIELGDVVSLTHFQGIAAAGWTGRPIRVVRHLVDPDKFVVGLEGYDVQRLFSGAFILGDEATLPAAWTSASTAQQRYGYLCDETTGKFSNGDDGKRLR